MDMYFYMKKLLVKPVKAVKAVVINQRITPPQTMPPPSQNTIPVLKLLHPRPKARVIIVVILSV